MIACTCRIRFVSVPCTDISLHLTDRFLAALFLGREAQAFAFCYSSGLFSDCGDSKLAEEVAWVSESIEDQFVQRSVNCSRLCPSAEGDQPGIQFRTVEWPIIVGSQAEQFRSSVSTPQSARS